LEEIVNICIEIGYSLLEAEGMILISMLVEKTGLNNLILKDKIIEILKTIVSTGDLFPIQSSSLLVLKGLISKNK